MKTAARLAVAAFLVLFAWKGADLSMSWPQLPRTKVVAPKPGKDLLLWADPVRPILPKMLPEDRRYLSAFYDATAFVLMNDGDREKPIIGTSDQFVVFHGGSLRLAVEKAKVGRYPGLGEAIDQTFLNAMGADQKKLDADARGRLVAACGVLSWTFGIHGDE